MNIHQTDLEKIHGVTIPDLNSDPFMFAKSFISDPKRRIEKYALDELKPLINWLEKNMKPSEEAVVIHGDYHHSNVIIKPDNTLVVIDWSNMRVSDFRIDLGFTATIEIAMLGSSSIQSVVDIYEEISGRKVKDLEYFMLLANLHNIMRMYSAAVNYDITGENDHTKQLFLSELKIYVEYLIKLVKEVTGISLDTLVEAIK